MHNKSQLPERNSIKASMNFKFFFASRFINKQALKLSSASGVRNVKECEILTL